MTDIQKSILWLLHDSGISRYRISQVTGIPQTTLSRYARGESEVGKMTLDNAEKLYNYYLEVRTVECADTEYILTSDPAPTGRKNEWKANARAIDGHPATVYWMANETGHIDLEKPAHAELVY